MKKLIKVLLLFVLVAISADLSAQVDTARAKSQFLFPEFSKAEVTFKTGPPQKVMMNYNMLSEKMVFKQNSKYLDMIKTETMDTVFIMDKKFIPVENIFLEVVLESKIPLYFQHKGSLIMPGKPAAYGGTSETSSSAMISTLYNGNSSYNLKLPSDYKVRKTTIGWVKKDGELQKFYNERQFLKIFKTNETKLKNFIKTEHINFEDQEDLINLLTFCNGLK
jgi:hypothetical protein